MPMISMRDGKMQVKECAQDFTPSWMPAPSGAEVEINGKQFKIVHINVGKKRFSLKAIRVEPGSKLGREFVFPK